VSNGLGPIKWRHHRRRGVGLAVPGIEDLLPGDRPGRRDRGVAGIAGGLGLGIVTEAELEIGRGSRGQSSSSGASPAGDPGSWLAGWLWARSRLWSTSTTGHQIKQRPTSTPVQGVLGFSEPPEAGDEFRVTPVLAQARNRLARGNALSPVNGWLARAGGDVRPLGGAKPRDST
jgi:hypothetical protein